MVTDPEGRSSIASSNCVHWYIIGTPNGAWSTAKCKKCELITAVENSQVVTAHGKPIPRGDDEKRDFLESLNVNIWELIPTDRPMMVLPYVKKYGIMGTARLLNIPKSTIGKWAKGESCFLQNGNVYSEKTRKELVQKAIKTNNIKKVAREAGIPRSTLQKWLRTHELQAFKTSSGGI